MAIMWFQIVQIPDLSLNKYQALSDAGVGGVLKRHESFLRQWHGICATSKTSFHLLYVFHPSEEKGRRMKLYFMLQGAAEQLQLLEPLLHNSPLSDFYEFTPAKSPSYNFAAGATLTKKEVLARINNGLAGQITSIPYVPNWSMNSSARLYDLFRIMGTISQEYTPHESCAFRIDMYPTAVALETREKVTPVLKTLRGETDIKLLREMEGMKADGYSNEVCKEYEDWLKNIETTPHFRANIYGFASDIFKAKVLLNAAGSEALDKGEFLISPIRPDSNGRCSESSRMGTFAEQYCCYPIEACLPDWSTTFCLHEIAPFFRFPVLFDGEATEIPKETAPVEVKNGLFLGTDKFDHPVYFPLENLSRHAFFTGMPGSGKTNTMLHLVTQLSACRIPFLALEPAKKEYRALLGREDMANVYLFSPHIQSRFPLRVNPMEFPRGVRLSEHISSLLNVFKGSFVLEGATYKFLSSAIQNAYIGLGWDIEDINSAENDLPYPTLQNVYDNLESEIKSASYDSDNKGNIQAFLQVRLGGLMELDAGELFNTPFSTIAPENWIKTSAIIELEVLSENAKNFFILLMCHYVLETLRTDPNGGFDTKGNLLPIRHALFIEEAHNIIAPAASQNSTEIINPKISATEYIVKMLAEVRALRESIIIADQLPTALASEVVKNTGLKVVHRLTAKDDREEIGTAISASSLQLEQMTSFTTGKALIYYEKTLKPFEIQIAKWVTPRLNFDVADDYLLHRWVFNRPVIQQSLAAACRGWILICLDKISLVEEQVNQVKGGSINITVWNRLKSQCTSWVVELEKMEKKSKQLKKLWLPGCENNHPLASDLDDLIQYLSFTRKRILDSGLIDFGIFTIGM